MAVTWSLFTSSTLGDVLLDHRYRDLEPRESRVLERASGVLLQPAGAVDLDARSEAARELMLLDHEDASVVLEEAVRRSDTPPLLAVLSASSTLETPSDALRASFLDVLPVASPGIQEPLGVELARFQVQYPSTLLTIRTLALDPAKMDTYRIAAIRSLPGFRSHGDDAIETVMVLLGRHGMESDEIVNAAIESAESLTGLPSMEHPADWTAWWSINRRRSMVDRMRNVLEAMNRRVLRIEVESEHARDDSRLASDRLIEVYRDLFPMLTLQQQQQKLLELLGDPRADVRRFAIDRVAMMLRDGNDTPQLRTSTMSLLRDPDIEVRRLAGSMLGELGHEGIETIVIESLENEEDPEVLAHALAAIDVHPTLAAVPAARTLLAMEIVRDQAARTLLSILKSDMRVDATVRMEIAAAAREAIRESSDPSIAALLVLTGNTADLDQLVLLLDAEDEATQKMIAESLLQRGRRAELLARADDEVLYPFALRAGVTGQAGDIRRLLAMEPPTEDLAEAWMNSVAELAGTLPSDRVLQLDDMVGATPHATDMLRARLLSAAVADAELDVELHRRILKRLIPMLLEQDAAASALTHIRGLDEAALDEELRNLSFISAIRARLYDDAAVVNNDPTMWVNAFEDTVASRPDSATDLRNEIVRRFSESLTPPMRTRLGLAEDPLMQSDDEEENPGDDASSGSESSLDATP
ncbi:MAG: HEAT repeat domain-containing protein [Planctomycetota bacterium]|nr:HEAT repeat domain-containing protein [Planctomycetota bacterium]